jgi:hypothetical protein
MPEEEKEVLCLRILIMACACHCAKQCSEALEVLLDKGSLADAFAEEMKKLFQPMKAAGGRSWRSNMEEKEEGDAGHIKGSAKVGMLRRGKGCNDKGVKAAEQEMQDAGKAEKEGETCFSPWHVLSPTSPNVLSLFMDQMVAPELFLSTAATNFRPLRLDRLWSEPTKADEGEREGLIQSLMGLTGEEESITELEYCLWTYTVAGSVTKSPGKARERLRGEAAAPVAMFAHQKLNVALTESKPTYNVCHTTKEDMECLKYLISDQVRRPNGKKRSFSAKLTGTSCCCKGK